MRTLIVAVLGLALLAGCTSTPRQIEISAKPISKPNLILPPAQQLNLKDVEWVIITQENAEEVFAQLLKDKKAIIPAKFSWKYKLNRRSMK